MSYAGFDQSENDVRQIERDRELPPDELYSYGEERCPNCASDDVKYVYRDTTLESFECGECGEEWDADA